MTLDAAVVVGVLIVADARLSDTDIVAGADGIAVHLSLCR